MPLGINKILSCNNHWAAFPALRYSPSCVGRYTLQSGLRAFRFYTSVKLLTNPITNNCVFLIIFAATGLYPLFFS